MTTNPVSLACGPTPSADNHPERLIGYTDEQIAHFLQATSDRLCRAALNETLFLRREMRGMIRRQMKLDNVL